MVGTRPRRFPDVNGMTGIIAHALNHSASLCYQLRASLPTFCSSRQNHTLEYLVSDLIDIEGIGHFHADKLASFGIRTQADFLAAAGTPSGRQKLVDGAGLTMEQVLNWANRADLARIKGIG